MTFNCSLQNNISESADMCVCVPVFVFRPIGETKKPDLAVTNPLEENTLQSSSLSVRVVRQVQKTNYGIIGVCT